MACQDLILPKKPLLLRHSKWLAPAEVSIGLRQAILQDSVILHDIVHHVGAKPIATGTPAHSPSHPVAQARPLKRGSKARYKVRFVDGAQSRSECQHEASRVLRRGSAQRQCLCRSGLHKLPSPGRCPPRSRARGNPKNVQAATNHALPSMSSLPLPVPRTSYAFCGIGMPTRQTPKIHYLLHYCESLKAMRNFVSTKSAHRLCRCTERGKNALSSGFTFCV